eukprot:3458327-Pleurochrysis_carterae.AAC.2
MRTRRRKGYRGWQKGSDASQNTFKKTAATPEKTAAAQNANKSCGKATTHVGRKESGTWREPSPG